MGSFEHFKNYLLVGIVHRVAMLYIATLIPSPLLNLILKINVLIY